MATVHAVKQTTLKVILTQAERQIALKVTLDLSREEAEILKSWVQNPCWTDPIDEPPVEKELRRSLFYCLQAELN